MQDYQNKHRVIKDKYTGLVILFGIFGIHRFYAKYYLSGFFLLFMTFVSAFLFIGISTTKVFFCGDYDFTTDDIQSSEKGSIQNISYDLNYFRNDLLYNGNEGDFVKVCMGESPVQNLLPCDIFSKGTSLRAKCDKIGRALLGPLGVLIMVLCFLIVIIRLIYDLIVALLKKPDEEGYIVL